MNNFLSSNSLKGSKVGLALRAGRSYELAQSARSESGPYQDRCAEEQN